MEKKIQTKRQLPNKTFYTVFLVAAIIFVCIKDFSTAIIFGGIGLVFDPFDQAMPFQKRPVWQRVWLLAHVVLVFVILFFSIKLSIH